MPVFNADDDYEHKELSSADIQRVKLVLSVFLKLYVNHQLPFLLIYSHPRTAASYFVLSTNEHLYMPLIVLHASAVLNQMS